MMGYQMVKKFENMFTSFDAILIRDKHMDRQTPHDSISRTMHSVARQKQTTLQTAVSLMNEPV